MRTRTSPKEVLLEEFMKPLGMTFEDVINKLDYKGRLHICAFFRKENGKINNTVAESLSVVFGTSKEFWLNLQKNYDESRGE